MNETTDTTTDAAFDDETVNVDEYDIPIVDDENTEHLVFVAGSTLIVRLDGIEPLRIPLRVTYATIKELRAGVPEDADELDQLVFLLEKIGDKALVDKLLNEVDLADAIAISVLFFRAWKKRTQVSLGKLVGSSRK